LVPPEIVVVPTVIEPADAEMVQLDPRVQVCPFTVVDALTRSLLVTRPVAVNDPVTVTEDMVGAVANTYPPPEPVGAVQLLYRADAGRFTLPAATRIAQAFVMVTEPAASGAAAIYRVSAFVIVTAEPSVIVGWYRADLCRAVIVVVPVTVVVAG
jgi:hypothetical protein